MSLTRRTFLKKSGLAVAASLASPSVFSFTKIKTTLSLQLYTVRYEMTKDPIGTLKQIANIGYKNVEHANYINRKFYGFTAKEFKKILSDLGMKMPSGHTALSLQDWDETKKDFTDRWKYTVDDAATVGQQYVISTSMEARIYQPEELKHFLDIFNKSGELCKKSGMKFGYHNNKFEFSEKLNGKMVYDFILENTNPALVAQQLDTGNLFKGGAKAIDIIKKYPGRFELLHVKEAVPLPSGTYESTILGHGEAQLKEVIDLAKAGGCKFFVVEQEDYQGKASVACAKEDYEVMKKWGY